MSTLNSNRPINQGVFTSRLPLAALASITHRITGVLLLAGVGLLIYLADVALSSEAGFADARALIDAGGLVTFLLWATLVAICYHFLAGVKHLLLDFHIGDNVRAAFGMSIAVIVLTAIDAIWLGVWLW
ncbi:MAG: succinate dehydrogenase, cytochrome b556 subunit [Pseudomonadales bacterium]|nr:succinate dehydrogenase, cytochrome b556 subunit [Pseudomonadales bacterium]MCP5183937.1 succinate dehydrogenase, cytochrome b556 subunit [Pseudomonadales bacterium]